MPSFNDQLKAARDALNKTQQEMADLLGIPKRTYWNYEQGKTRPNVDEADDIRNTLQQVLGQGRASPSGDGHDRESTLEPSNPGAYRDDDPHRFPPHVKDLIRIVPTAQYHRIPETRGTSEPEPQYIGHAVRDRRMVPTYEDGREAEIEDAVVPSSGLESFGLLPGNRIDLQPCGRFVGRGLYVVFFAQDPDIWYVDKLPHGGFKFANDRSTFFVDSIDGELRERESKLPADVIFFRRVLSASTTLGIPKDVGM